jgi:hypothetical protein
MRKPPASRTITVQVLDRHFTVPVSSTGHWAFVHVDPEGRPIRELVHGPCRPLARPADRT